MATKTNESKPDVVGAVLRGRADLHDAAESLMRATPYTGKPDHDFDAEQRAVFDGVGWSERDLRREHKRARRAVELEAQAGSKSDLAKARAAATKTAAKRDTEGRELREQIAAAEKRIAELDQAATAAADDVAAREAAREKLRDSTLLPPRLRDQYRRNRQTLRERFHPVITALESEIARCTAIERTRHDTADALLIAERLPAGHPCKPGADGGGYAISARDVPAGPWLGLQREAATQREELEAQLAKVKAEAEPLFAAVDADLDYYLSGLDS